MQHCRLFQCFRCIVSLSDNGEVRGVFKRPTHRFSPAVREAMRWALENAPDFSVIGEADDAAEALEQTAMLHPDVVLLDIELPDLDGYAVSRALKAGSSAPIVVFLT